MTTSILPPRRIRGPIGMAVALALTLMGTGCSSDDDGGTGTTITHPEDFLPTNVSGWSSTEVKSGTTAASLQDDINGGYETYTGHGMKEFAHGSYEGSGSQAGGVMEIFIYEMDGEANALDLYDDSNIVPSAIDEEPNLGDTARLSSFLGGKMLELVRDQYYVSVSISNLGSLEDAESQALLLATSIDQEIAS